MLFDAVAGDNADVPAPAPYLSVPPVTTNNYQSLSQLRVLSKETDNIHVTTRTWVRDSGDIE